MEKIKLNGKITNAIADEVLDNISTQTLVYSKLMEAVQVLEKEFGKRMKISIENDEIFNGWKRKSIGEAITMKVVITL